MINDNYNFGFAVIANEIKELAKQTAQATVEISSRIEGIQGSTGKAVDEIENILRKYRDAIPIFS